MVFYGLFTDGILTGDFLVRKTRYDSPDNVHLARRQSKILFRVFAAVAAAGRWKVGVKDFDEVGDAVLTHPEFAAHNSPDAFEENLRRRVFQDDSASAQLERLDDLLFSYGSGQQYRSDRGRGIPQLTERLQPAHARHHQIQEEDIRMQFSDKLQRLLPVRGFSDNAEAGLIPENRHQSLPEDRVIVRNQNSGSLHTVSCGFSPNKV